MAKIVCGKYDSLLVPFPEKISLVKFQRKQSLYKKKKFFPLAFCDDSFFDGEKQITVDDLSVIIAGDNRIIPIVLTNKEKKLSLDQVIRNNINIVSMEDKFPIFPKTKFLNNPVLNYQELLRNIKYLQKIGVTTEGLSKKYQRENAKSINRKISYKTDADKYFNFGFLPPFQEVFRFAEERADRCIIALDYNSMFSDCMKGDFLDPQYIKKITINCNFDKVLLNDGLYKVFFKGPKGDFIKKYHPFKYTVFGKSYQFYLGEDDEVELLLYKNEIEYFSKFFKTTYIDSGLVSDHKIQHPLYAKSLLTYKKRLSAKEKNKVSLANLYKYQLATFHSATNPRRRKYKKFNSQNSLLKWLHNEFGYNVFSGSFPVRELRDCKSKKLETNYHLDGTISVSFLNIDNKESLYSLSGQVLANSRVKIMKLLEKVSSFPCLDICYVNTDSVHISIPKNEKEKFLLILGDDISTSIGRLKVEAVGDKAFWFDVGRYFILKKNEVIKFKNRTLNHPGNKNPFLERNLVPIVVKSKNFKHVNKFLFTLPNLLNYNKRLIKDRLDGGYIDFSRFNFEEVRTYKVAHETVTKEMLSSTNFKLRYYRALKELTKKRL